MIDEPAIVARMLDGPLMASELLSSVACVKQAGPTAAVSRRPVVGEKVTVSPGYASCGDAGDGPLRPGEHLYGHASGDGLASLID